MSSNKSNQAGGGVDSAKAVAHTAAWRAARRIAAEIHFREKHGVTSAENPDNAAFLDRRAAELAPIVQEEYGNSHYQLLEALKELCGKDNLGGSLARDAHIAIPMRACWQETSAKLWAAILKAEQAIAAAESEGL